MSQADRQSASQPAPTGQASRTSLQELHDIERPAGVDLWPPAPGWLVLAAILLLAGAWLGARIARRRRALRYREAALTELEGLRESERAGSSARGVAVLLKRTAIHVYSRERVAALSGRAWCEFLDARGGDGRFAGPAGAALLESAYGPRESVDAGRSSALFEAAETWIHAQGPVLSTPAQEAPETGEAPMRKPVAGPTRESAR